MPHTRPNKQRPPQNGLINCCPACGNDMRHENGKKPICRKRDCMYEGESPDRSAIKVTR